MGLYMEILVITIVGNLMGLICWYYIQPSLPEKRLIIKYITLVTVYVAGIICTVVCFLYGLLSLFIGDIFGISNYILIFIGISGFIISYKYYLLLNK